ncbi:Protein trichome berefringence-like 7 [Ranunculus cassubicifolius]
MMEMMSHFSRRSSSINSPRVVSSPRVVAYRNRWISQSVQTIIVICLLVSAAFVLLMGCGYFFVFPNLSQAIHGYGVLPVNSSIDTCDVFEGSWVRDVEYPLYNGSECPFAERGFNCLANGRKDDEYLKWRWKPESCDLPRFNVQEILENLRGKRIVLVGDSMSRTQWESLICLLMTGVEDKKSVYEVNGNKITKQIRFLGVRFASFNFTIEFFRSVYLVQRGWVPKHGPRRVRSTLKLDKLDEISKYWIDSDVLIFNTGQWWNPGKLFDTGCYFQVGGSLKLGMQINTGFRTALSTWASWVETMVNTNRTKVFFRTFEPSHWSDQHRRYCNMTQQPVSETQGKDQSPFSDIISEVVNNMSVPVTILRVTLMGAFRSDAHVGKWSDTPAVVDCSHWCLPGVPDMWNEIVFSYLFASNKGFSPRTKESMFRK